MTHSMHSGTSDAITTGILRAAPAELVGHARPGVAEALRELLAPVPEPEDWIALGEPGGAVAHLLLGRRLFSAFVAFDERAEGVFTTDLVSRTLDHRHAYITLSLDGWRFDFGDPARRGRRLTQQRRSPIILGRESLLNSASGHDVMREDAFARAMAEKLGWSVIRAQRT